MAYYETGSAADVNDMLGKIRVALAAQGWTVNHNDFEGGSGGVRCHMTKGGMTVNLRTGFNNEVPVSTTAERSTRQGSWSWAYSWSSPTLYWQPDWIAMNCGTGVDLGRSWHIQPGAPGYTESKGLASMITVKGAVSRYWLFVMDSPDAVYVVMETGPNRFQHLAWGRLVMAQEVESGGEWFVGSRKFNEHYGNIQEFFYGRADNSSAFVRLADSRWTIDDQLDGWNKGIFEPAVPNAWTTDDWWGKPGIPVLDERQSLPQSSGYRNALNQSYIEDEGRSILWPVAVWKEMYGGGYTLLGHLPHLARVSLQAYVAGDPIAGVGETYLAFPGHCRASPWSVYDYSSKPANPADEAYNFYGTGFAIRRP